MALPYFNMRARIIRNAYKIAGIPVWDGMIAIQGRLYMALQDGSILCMGAGVP